MLKRLQKAIKIWKATKNDDIDFVNKTLDEVNSGGSFIPFPDEDEWSEIERDRVNKEKLGSLYDKIKKLL